ncbi:MAG: LLM class F420-dependent oxidoreductase [Alphaproteobacteria bacterium]|jgi:probable F420-dependent oxidoreductase|nr:LLM class F420-dependent oxidoreductase [Alphaproteobacteria bacterium]
MRIGISLPVRELQNDIAAIKDFAQAAEDLGLTHLRVPDQVIRPGAGPLHEPMTLMALIAGVTSKIELVPSVIILPARQTVLVAKQTATLDVLSGGRLRLGIGIGKDPAEYDALGADFTNRGARCEEQMALLQQLWSQEVVEFDGKWEQISGLGLNPLPIQRPIPMWIGASAVPSARIRRRIGRWADGWFALCSPEEYPEIRDDIRAEASAAGRDPDAIGTEAGVAVVGPREAEWQTRVAGWREAGLSHLCLRTLGGGISADQHIPRMRQAVAELP